MRRISRPGRLLMAEELQFRQVQYMAGQNYVSSTERYQLNNLRKLQSKIDKPHPLGKIEDHNL